MHTYYTYIYYLFIYLYYHRDDHIDKLDFHLAKNDFILRHKLPKNFKFSYYIKKSMHSFIVNTLEVSPSAWIILVILLGLNLLRYHITISIEGPDSTSR